MAAAVDLYRLVGLEVPEPFEWPAGSSAQHVEIHNDSDCCLALDNRPQAKIWNNRFDPDRGNGNAVVGLLVDSRDDVDRLYHAVKASPTNRASPTSRATLDHARYSNVRCRYRSAAVVRPASSARSSLPRRRVVEHRPIPGPEDIPVGGEGGGGRHPTRLTAASRHMWWCVTRRPHRLRRHQLRRPRAVPRTQR
ncbi:MAG: DUF2094 domain-containing protein [Actinobacteria bacterium]|nr:DUF2094 domain-containing protein [Actinomycetota bacterium]